MKNFNYGKDYLTIGLALEICSGKLKGLVNPETSEKIKQSNGHVEKIIRSKRTVYGINTGFGPLCTTLISESDTKQLQHNLLVSHSVGVGEYIPDEIAKLMMILKVHSLCKGFSGISPFVVERILYFINNGIAPCVPSQGSVGASGDLAPLAHLFLPLIGLGKVRVEGKVLNTIEVLKKENLEPLELTAKDGLALINGTQFIAAYAVKVAERFQSCLDQADIIAAMNLDAMMGSVKPFESLLHDLRPFEGNKYVAGRLRSLLSGSAIGEAHHNCQRVQDPYSLRCIPQVHGASRNAWHHLKEMLHIELNSVTDNPIVIDENNTISGGNFHGQPMALPLDYTSLAASELGNIADRRIYLSLEGEKVGLPKLLLKSTGLNSGFMILQYTTAALASENKTNCFPASADSIPTSIGQEDHVSMGSIGARKAYGIVGNLEKILAIELFCASQGLYLRKPLKTSPILQECLEFVHSKITPVEKDRVFCDDIEKAIEIIKSNELLGVVNKNNTEESPFLKNEQDEVFGIY